ncbi:MAG: DNA-processing protein DprA, partial [Dehalococcoidia bacterium]|nr:DNA-processing protein DprA [Dehalococcoidia bacterium]
MNNTPFAVAFSLISGVGPVKLRLIQERFGDLSWAWRAGAADFAAAGLDDRTVQEIVARRPAISPEREMERLDEKGIDAVTWDHPSYPLRLKEIYGAPAVLYVKGAFLPEDEWAIAVVGTRRATVYGREATDHLAAGLARSKVTVVSGLARGIDTVAHQVALREGGRTIAVLGSGLDNVYPAENARLAASIAERGVLVSEYPLGTKPAATNFPWRNRIISGLSLGVLVVEAGEDSGANITVKYALEQDREVFAVPGGIFWPKSRGAYKWIRQGAKLVMDVGDMLEELNLQMIPLQREARVMLPADEVEASLL